MNSSSSDEELTEWLFFVQVGHMSQSVCSSRCIFCVNAAGGDSKTLMIVQVAPVEKNVSETTCSLSFGQRVRTVELGAASRKIEAGDVEVGHIAV